MVSVAYTRFDIWNGSLNMVDVWYTYFDKQGEVWDGIERIFNRSNACVRMPLASKQASTYVTNTLPQCSPASVGLAQARPNNHGLRTRGAKCGCRLETSKLRLAEWTKTMHDHAVARFCVVFTVVLASEPYCRGNPKHLV